MQSENHKDERQDTQNTELGLLKSKRKRRGPAERMWAPIKLKLDENYRYVTKNWGLRFLYYFSMFVGMPFVYLYYKLRYRMTVEGMENVRAVKKTAAVTICNHVHNTDSFMLTYLFYPNTPYFVALRHNFEAFLVGGLVRVMRGIPLPEDIKNFERFSVQMGDVLRNTTKKIHFYPEGEISPYSRELRKFKNGAFHFAVKNNVPVLPIVIVFPAKKRIKIIAGKPIYMEDVEGAEGLAEPKRVVLMARHAKKAMQDIMDKFYSEHNIDTKEPAK